MPQLIDGGVGGARDAWSEERIGRLVTAAQTAATGEAIMARAALIDAGVRSTRGAIWVAETVDAFGAALAERSSWRGAARDRHDVAAVAPARAAVEVFASFVALEAYEWAITVEQAVAALQCDPADMDEVAVAGRALELAREASGRARAWIEVGACLDSRADVDRLGSLLAAVGEAAGAIAVATTVDGEGSPAWGAAVRAFGGPWLELGRLLRTPDGQRLEYVRACRLEGLLREVVALAGPDRAAPIAAAGTEVLR